MINLSKNDIPNVYKRNELEPPPDELNLESGKSMWIIKDYRIWAFTYQEALSLLPIIESL